VVNINNIPALTDIKSNFAVYGRVRVLESDKAQQFENYATPEQVQANRQKSLTMVDPMDKDKDDGKENQSYFRKRLFVPEQG
jgi:hypothetical protein